MILLFAKTLTFPDWLPSAMVAVIGMMILVILFVTLRKAPANGKIGRADVIALLTMLVLSTYGVFALLRMVI